MAVAVAVAGLIPLVAAVRLLCALCGEKASLRAMLGAL